MKLPRDLDGRAFARALKVLGYEVTRQTGSHLRLTTLREGEHHVTIPDHRPMRAGTVAAILGDVAEHFRMTRAELLQRLFG
jgi:predicted RNA binding protein YcfA (HicA-like mRNA interferase family)